MSELSSRQTQLESFDKLLTVMDELREKCPWDRKQTIESLRHLTIEETFELSDAILEGDMEEIKKELGDILLHIVFYAKIGSEKGAFDISTMIDALTEKLIRRHPHIYGDTIAADEEAVKQNWEKIKLGEKGTKNRKADQKAPAYIRRYHCRGRRSSQAKLGKNKAGRKRYKKCPRRCPTVPPSVDQIHENTGKSPWSRV